MESGSYRKRYLHQTLTPELWRKQVFSGLLRRRAKSALASVTSQSCAIVQSALDARGDPVDSCAARLAGNNHNPICRRSSVRRMSCTGANREVFERLGWPSRVARGSKDWSEAVRWLSSPLPAQTAPGSGALSHETWRGDGERRVRSTYRQCEEPPRSSFQRQRLLCPPDQS